MKKPIRKGLIISIITGLLYVSYMIYTCIMANKGYVDTATGVYVYEKYYLTGIDMILVFLSIPCFLISIATGISSIVTDFKANERKSAIITIVGLIFLLFFNFGGISLINDAFAPPKDAKEKATKCEQSIECYKNDDIAFCVYKGETIKCPIVVVENKIKENKTVS